MIQIIWKLMIKKVNLFVIIAWIYQYLPNDKNTFVFLENIIKNDPKDFLSRINKVSNYFSNSLN